MLMTAPVLAYPSFDRPFILCTDASDYAAGAVLEQADDQGRLHPISFYSRIFDCAQRNYSTSERECLALVEAIKHYDYYLAYSHFVVYTDHRALEALKNPRNQIASRRLSHWQIMLQYCDCLIHHRPGKLQTVPDALTRMPGSKQPLPPDTRQFPPISTVGSRLDSHGRVMDWEENERHIVSVVDVAPVSDLEAEIDYLYALHNQNVIQRLQTEQLSDVELIPYILFLRDHTISSDPKVAQRIMKQCTKLSLVKGILVHVNPNTDASYTDASYRVVLPKGILSNNVIWRYHSHFREGAHHGFSKTYERFCRKFWFPGCYITIQKMLATCKECQQTKASHQPRPVAKLFPPVVPGPLENIEIDFVGPLPVSNHGNKWLMVITDYITKGAEIYPLRDEQSPEVVACLADWVSRYGAPLAISSDRGANFLSTLVENFCRIWDVQHSVTASYHPQANAKVESLNGTLCDLVRPFCKDVGSTWDEHLSALMFAYRNGQHSATGVSPAKLLYGIDLRTPLDAELDLYLESYRSKPHDSDFRFAHAEALIKARDAARANMEQSALYSAERFNSTHKIAHLCDLPTFPTPDLLALSGLT